MVWNWADITNPKGATRTPWNWAQVSAPETGANAPTAQFRQRALESLGGAKAAGPAAAITPLPSQRNIVADRVARETITPMAEQGPSYMGMSPDELLAYLLGGSGGGAPDLSGYQQLIDDVNARRDALNIRKWQQRQFLNDLFDAAGVRAAADRDAIAAAVSGQLESDAARRAEEIALIRGDEAARRQTADLARGALGVAPGPDLSTAAAESAVGEVGAAGSIADRDARIRQAIAEQQVSREIAGLAPLEAMSVGQLMSGYEDRLAALASERAGIKAQMAQARAAARGGGPSTSEKLNALQFVQGAFGPGEGVPIPDLIQTEQGIQQQFGPAANDVLGIAARVLNSAVIDPATGKLESPQQTLARISREDSAVSSFLRSYPTAGPIIINYTTQALK